MLPGVSPPERVGFCAGIDEAGRGCLAGPVVAAAVVLPPSCDLPGLADSKTLTPARREALAAAIRVSAVAWGVGISRPAEIDRVNILQATFRAMIRAARACGAAELLIDGPHVIPPHLFAAFGRTAPKQRAVVRGDALIPCISAASILAKCFRDRIMLAVARRRPGYGFERHKGYGTAEHLAALAEFGPCPMHRRSFRRVRPEEPARQGSLL